MRKTLIFTATYNEKDQKSYTEKVLYLPNCYQSNPKNDSASKNNYSKSDFNLPENKFIYCSFNNHNKITPQIFLSWMKILKKVKFPLNILSKIRTNILV